MSIQTIELSANIVTFTNNYFSVNLWQKAKLSCFLLLFCVVVDPYKPYLINVIRKNWTMMKDINSFVVISIQFRAKTLEGADRKVAQRSNNSVFSLQRPGCGQTCDEPPWKPRWFRGSVGGGGCPVFLHWQLTECQERPYLHLAAHGWLAKKMCWNMSDLKQTMWNQQTKSQSFWLTLVLTSLWGFFEGVMNKGLKLAFTYFNPFHVFLRYISETTWEPRR